MSTSNLAAEIAGALKKEAETGVGDDSEEALAYLQRCTVDVGTGVGKGVRFTYARAIDKGLYFLYLAMSFRHAPYTKPGKFDHGFARRAVPFFFDEHINSVLVFAPQTAEGKQWNTWSFHRYTDPAWQPVDYKPVYVPGEPFFFTWAEYGRALLN